MLAAHEPRIREWLFPDKPGRRALRLTKVHVLLARQGVDVTYTTLWRWAHDELGWRERKPTVRVDDPPPGEEAQAGDGPEEGRAPKRRRRRLPSRNHVRRLLTMHEKSGHLDPAYRRGVVASLRHLLYGEPLPESVSTGD